MFGNWVRGRQGCPETHVFFNEASALGCAAFIRSAQSMRSLIERPSASIRRTDVAIVAGGILPVTQLAAEGAFRKFLVGGFKHFKSKRRLHTVAQPVRRLRFERFVLCAFSQFARSLRSKRIAPAIRSDGIIPSPSFVSVLASYSKKSCTVANAQCLLSAFQNLHESHRAPIQVRIENLTILVALVPFTPSQQRRAGLKPFRPVNSFLQAMSCGVFVS